MAEDILLEHFARYPGMEPQDAVKLLYQREFGPAHMLRDPKGALTALRREMTGLGEPLSGERLYEPIGGGLCRLNLRPCLSKGISAEDICALCLETAEGMRGDEKRFRQALRVLQRLAEEEETPFDAAALDIFLARYPARPCPVHHSDAYRAAYRPAYRLVSQKKIKDYLAEKRGGIV